jgi:hypothetical protein
MRIVETELIERHAWTLVEMEGSGFASILKVVADSPAMGGVAAASADARLGFGGVGRGRMGTGTGTSTMDWGDGGDSSGVVIGRARIGNSAAMYDLFWRVP